MKANERHYTLGKLIAALENEHPEADVRFCFEYLAPTGLTSYRGYYGDLAITFDGGAPFPSVETVLLWLRDAKSKVFHGYKGGDYRMSDNTPMWVANYGNSGGTGVVGVTSRHDGASVYLETELVDP